MPRNRHRNAHQVKVAAVAWWILIFAILCGTGLVYVHIKNQTIAFSEQRRTLESDLKGFTQQNRAVTSQINQLTSRYNLERQLAAGFIQLVEIDPAKIIRLNPATPIAEGQNEAAVYVQK